jgi:transcriptional regulator with XRE-family HTH domain
MTEFSTQEFARRVLAARAGRGIRAVAQEIKISPATLSRVEHGHVPDLETFQKICLWLNVDPGSFLGFKQAAGIAPEVRMHFRKEAALKPGTAKALAELIKLAHQEMLEEERL